MTARPPSTAPWRLVDIRPATDEGGAAAVAVRLAVDGPRQMLSPDEAEDAAWRLLEAAKLARAGTDRDGPERAD